MKVEFESLSNPETHKSGWCRTWAHLVLYLSYELVKEGLGVPSWDIRGLGCQLQGSYLWASGLFYFMGGNFSVFAEGDSISLHTGVNLDCDEFCSPLGHHL